MSIKIYKSVEYSGTREEYYQDKISSSDARAIASGDYYDLEKLWEQKIDHLKDDLSNVFPVQLGLATEDFHTSWLNKQLTRNNVVGYGHEHNLMYEQAHCVIESDSTSHPFILASTIDIAYAEEHLVQDTDKGISLVELKHTGEYSNLDTVIKNYYPQLQHHMYVWGRDEIMISAIFGNKKQQHDIVKRDNTFLSEYMKRAMELGALIHDYWHAPEQFYEDGEKPNRDEWWKVSQELDWVTGVPIEKDIVCASGKVYNLNECADWNWAKEFIDKAIETSVSNTGFSKSKEENEHNKNHLKKLIPDDAKSVTYNGITASRNKNGIVSIRIK
tara:strand:+ start:2622 stop:3611 length:990 start_codon:yes stop_codon:yes gene_type:complete